MNADQSRKVSSRPHAALLWNQLSTRLLQRHQLMVWLQCSKPLQLVHLLLPVEKPRRCGRDQSNR